jgi:hypothetical protein
MWNRVLMLAALASVPSVALASDVFVNVRTVGHDARTIVEFRPKHGAYVALYGHFSDGEVRPLFPSSDCSSFWVDGREVRVIEVVPCGARLEDVQVITSSHWFDPSECWVAWTPRSPHGVIVYTAAAYPTSTWRFSLAWGPSRTVRVARSWCWEPEQAWWGYEGGRRYVARHAPYPKHDARPHQSRVKFKDDDRRLAYEPRAEKSVVASATKSRDGRESSSVTRSSSRTSSREGSEVGTTQGRNTKNSTSKGTTKGKSTTEGDTKRKSEDSKGSKSSSTRQKGSGEPGR